MTDEPDLNGAPPLATHGRYADHLAPYFDLFPRENIKIVLFEDLKRKPDALFADLERFLGVEHVPLPHLHLNASRPVRSALVRRVLDAKQVARALLPKRVLRGLTGAVHRIASLNTGPATPGSRLVCGARLEERFYEDNIRRLSSSRGSTFAFGATARLCSKGRSRRREHLSEHAHSQNSGAGLSL